jgi:hypothetical protein
MQHDLGGHPMSAEFVQQWQSFVSASLDQPRRMHGQSNFRQSTSMSTIGLGDLPPSYVSGLQGIFHLPLEARTAKLPILRWISKLGILEERIMRITLLIGIAMLSIGQEAQSRHRHRGSCGCWAPSCAKGVPGSVIVPGSKSEEFDKSNGTKKLPPMEWTKVHVIPFNTTGRPLTYELAFAAKGTNVQGFVRWGWSFPYWEVFFPPMSATKGRIQITLGPDANGVFYLYNDSDKEVDVEYSVARQ